MHPEISRRIRIIGIIEFILIIAPSVEFVRPKSNRDHI